MGRKPLTISAEDVLDEIEAGDGEPVSAPELSRCLGVSAVTITRRLKELEEQGKVQRLGAPNRVLWETP